MKSKYLIPMLIGVILVAMTTPANATTYTLNEEKTQVNDYMSVVNTGDTTTQFIDISIGDTIQWSNSLKCNDDVSGTIYCGVSSSTYNRCTSPDPYSNVLGTIIYGATKTVSSSVSVVGNPETPPFNYFSRSHSYSTSGNPWINGYSVGVISMLS